MPVKGKDETPIIEILEGVELVVIKCIRNMVEIIELPSKVISYKSKWRLFKARFEPDAPEVPIYDVNGYVSPGHTTYALTPIKDTDWIEKWLEEVPEDIEDKLKNIIRKHGLSEDNLAESLSKILMTPIPRLKNPSVIAKMSEEKYKEHWNEFIESVVSPGAEKDYRLVLVFKSHLLRGTVQRYNPHTLEVTNSNTGKSTYYDMVGVRIDKTTANKLIGFADAQTPHPGAIDNLDIVLCIEQIESQTAPQILNFLLNFMESGKAISETGAQKITVKGNCPITITANPTGYKIDRINTFRALIDHLTGNLIALGRRFSTIIYGDDYGNVQIKKPFSSIEWQNNVQKLRSIEDYTLLLIKDLFEDKKVLGWLEEKLPEYEKRGKELIKEVKDEGVEDFLTTHFESAYPHIRGAALNCAIIDFIPRLVKVKMTGKEDGFLTMDILAKAEGYLKEIIAINLESVANMASAEENIRDIIFEQLPKYLQELVLASIEYRKRGLKTREVLVSDLDNYSLKHHFDYMSQVVNALDNVSLEKINNHNRLLAKYWWVRVVSKEQHIYSIEFVR